MIINHSSINLGIKTDKTQAQSLFSAGNKFVTIFPNSCPLLFFEQRNSLKYCNCDAHDAANKDENYRNRVITNGSGYFENYPNEWDLEH